MADDKGGGGSAWGPLEIIFVIILVIALLDKLTGKQTVLFPGNTDSQTPTQSQPAKPDATKNGCGLTIITPEMNAKVGTSIAIVGSVAGCNWVPTQDIALYAQVIDANGLPVSLYEAIAPSTTRANGEVTFSTTISLNKTPATTKGTIIFIPATPVPNRAVTIRMPLTFIGQ